MEEDFSPEEDSAGSSVTTMPQISALSVITVKPITGRVLGSRWQVSGDMNTFKLIANRVLPGVEDDSVSFYIKLAKFLMFELRATGQHRNISQWLSWEKVFVHGSITLRNKKGDINSTDKKAI